MTQAPAEYTSQPHPSKSRRALSLKHWEDHYRNGAAATCPTSPGGGLDREVLGAWVEFFTSLPDQARVLDIGTGNGIVPSIAVEAGTALGRQWRIDAIDLADIDPVAHVKNGARVFAGVAFHPRVPAERLPFDDGTFDAACGHHALEFTKVPAALAELHRVLRPGSDAQFVLLHADSVVMAAARTAIDEADVVLNQTKIYRKVHRLVAMDRDVPQVTARAAEDVRQAVRTLRGAWEQAKAAGNGRTLGVALDAAQKLLKARTEVEPWVAAAEVDRAEQELRVAVRRLRDQVEHALDEGAMEELAGKARDAGFSRVEYMPQFHGGSALVGWQLLMHRA